MGFGCISSWSLPFVLLPRESPLSGHLASCLRRVEVTCVLGIYSRLSLSRLCLSRITAYLEEKIWSLYKHRNLTSGYKILWERGEIVPEEQFLPFPTIFSRNISNYRSLIAYSFAKFGCAICIFLNSENLICRSTDISKCFRGSLQLRDNESRLYYQYV